MDATLSTSTKRKQLLPTVVAVSVGVVLWALASRSLAAGSGSTIVVADSKPKQQDGSPTSARGTLTFVTPAAPTQEPKHLVRPIDRSQPWTRPIATPARQVKRPAPTQQVAPPRPMPPVQRRHTVAPSKVRQLTEAIRNASGRSRRPVRKLASPRQTEQADRVRVVQHQEESSPADPGSELLVEAHALSLQAKTEAEYTHLLEQCTKAVNLGVDKERRRFAHHLMSWALNRRGQLRADDGQQESADADFRAALDYNPLNWRALHNRGVSLAQNGFPAKAFDDFNRVTQLSPKYAKAFVNRATLFVQANDLQTALEDYQQAIRLEPNLETAQVGIARVYHMLGQRENALAHFKAAVRLAPTNAEVVCSRGDLLADMGRYGDALADYARTIEINPDFAHAYRNGAWLLATCPDQQFRDAENALLGARQALEFEYGQRHVALDTLAAALANAGQFDEAIRTVRYALDIAPAEAKTAYTTRLQLYQQQRPFRTELVGNAISQAVYEVTDR